MSRFIVGADRQQVTLLPECLDDFIDEDNTVRVVDAFITAARAQVAAAHKALLKAKARDGDLPEADAVIAACESELGRLSQEAAALHNQLRTVKIETLKESLQDRIAAFDAHVMPVGKLFADVLAAEQYLTELGTSPSIRNQYTSLFCLPAFRDVGNPMTLSDLISEQTRELRREFQII